MIVAPGDAVTWEAVYRDGTMDIERHGATYGNIRRGCLMEFRLVSPRGTLGYFHPPFGQTGRNLVYRRRTTLAPEGKKVGFVVGWVPSGPVLYLDPETGTYRYADHFVEGDPDLYPPEFLPEEGSSELSI